MAFTGTFAGDPLKDLFHFFFLFLISLSLFLVSLSLFLVSLPLFLPLFLFSLSLFLSLFVVSLLLLLVFPSLPLVSVKVSLSTACLGTEYIYEQPTTAASKKELISASRSFESDLEYPPS